MREIRPSGSEGGVTARAVIPTPMCESEVMMITGASPSPMEAWNQRESEGQLRCREAGWRAAGGESSGPKHRTNGAEPDSAGRQGRVCVAKTKPGAYASRVAGTRHAGESTTRFLNVLEVSMRMRRHHDVRNETRAGARRERCGSHSRHSSKGARESRVSEGR